jgi:allantoin racemase
MEKETQKLGPIWWINPVGTSSFDEEVVQAWAAVGGSPDGAVVTHLPSGPTNLEYRFYAHQVIGPILDLARQAQDAGARSVVIGCFFDVGLAELRESLELPVIGMGEASMLLASTLGHRFTVIAGRRNWVAQIENQALLAGVDRRLASIRVVDVGVEQALADPETYVDRVKTAARLAAERDAAEVVVFTEILPLHVSTTLKSELGVSCVDPGIAAWKWAEMMGGLYENAGISHSKLGSYEPAPRMS